jgi:hypothetical protein
MSAPWAHGPWKIHRCNYHGVEVGNFKAVQRYREESSIATGQLALHGHGFGRMRMFTLEGDKDFFVYVAMPCAHDDFAHGNRCFAAVLQVGVETQGDFL